MDSIKKGMPSNTPNLSKNSSTSKSEPIRQNYKNKHTKDQFKNTFDCFFNGALTMKQVSVILEIDRANICRYCAKLRKSNRIGLVKMGYCPITKHRAGFYTTNPELFPVTNQLKMF